MTALFRLAPMLLTVALLSAARAAPVVLGAGATFPAPLYERWAADYRQRTGTEVRFDAVGSGAGIDSVRRGQVDFGATDWRLPPEQLARDRLQQVPVVIGGVVPVFNVTGIGAAELRLTGEVLADIYLGQVRRWNDPRLQALNPGLHLPAANITVVHRSDASGTSHLWTDFLSANHADWRSRIGGSLTPAWPVGVGGAGNEGVASYVQRTRMSIGYVEYTYAVRNHLTMALLRNRAGDFVTPRGAAFEAGHAFPAHPDAWPIVGASYILFPLQGRPVEAVRAARRFFAWALRQGQPQALALGYVPLPAAGADAIEVDNATDAATTAIPSPR